jgi:integrase
VAFLTRRKYKVTLPNGKSESRQCDHWTIQYRDAAGKIQRVKGFKDKAATKQLAAKLERQIERGDPTVDLIDPYKAHKARPLAEHVAEYITDLRTRARKRNSGYAYRVERRLNVLLDPEHGCGWKTLADIDANSFLRWRSERQKTGHPKGRGNLSDDGAAAETLNQYLEVARAFTNWCASNGRLPGIAVGSRVISPILSGVAKVEGPQLRKRRALSDDETMRILDAAPDSRKLFYRVGMALGLRRSELEQLVWGDVRLNAIRPYVQLRAEATKAGRADRLDIPATLVDELRKQRPTDAKDGQRVFSEPPTIDEWKKDLAAAKVPYIDDMGRQADFHAGTRKTLCSRMHRQGVPLAVAMRRMRHTDAKLTMVDYTDDAQIGMEAGVLPELLPAAKPPSAAQTATAATA